jgi:hypothetical protein
MESAPAIQPARCGPVVSRYRQRPSPSSPRSPGRRGGRRDRPGGPGRRAGRTRRAGAQRRTWRAAPRLRAALMGPEGRAGRTAPEEPTNLAAPARTGAAAGSDRRSACLQRRWPRGRRRWGTGWESRAHGSWPQGGGDNRRDGSVGAAGRRPYISERGGLGAMGRDGRRRGLDRGRSLASLKEQEIRRWWTGGGSPRGRRREGSTLALSPSLFSRSSLRQSPFAHMAGSCGLGGGG